MADSAIRPLVYITTRKYEEMSRAPGARRACIFVVKNNQELKAYHKHYTTRKKNPLKKIQSLMAIAGKIARIFYSILKNGKDYDPVVVMRDFNKEKAAA